MKTIERYYLKKLCKEVDKAGSLFLWCNNEGYTIVATPKDIKFVE